MADLPQLLPLFDLKIVLSLRAFHSIILIFNSYYILRRGDLIKITNKTVPSINSMQVLLEEQSNAYYNFINSLHSESTKQSYKFCLEKFLNHYGIDLLSFLKLPQQGMTNLVPLVYYLPLVLPLSPGSHPSRWRLLS
jgi:hypothetical protein